MHSRRILKKAETGTFEMPSLERRDGLRGGVGGFEVHLAEIERDAYERGFAAGEQAGREMGDRKAALLTDRLERVVAEIETVRDGIAREIEPMVLGIAHEIARKIILKELELNPEIIVAVTKEAMQRIERTGKVTIKINPSLFELFKKLKPELLEVHPTVLFDVDPAVPATGSVVIGAFEEVVTDMDEQVKNIVEDVEDSLGAH